MSPFDCFICGEQSLGEGKKLNSIFLEKLAGRNIDDPDPTSKEEIACCGHCAKRIIGLVESIFDQVEELVEQTALELQLIRTRVAKAVKKEQGQSSSGKLGSQIISELKSLTIESVLKKVSERANGKESTDRHRDHPNSSSLSAHDPVMENVTVARQIQGQVDCQSQNPDEQIPSEPMIHKKEKVKVNNGNETTVPTMAMAASDFASDEIRISESFDEFDVKDEVEDYELEPSAVNPFADTTNQQQPAGSGNVKKEPILNTAIDVNLNQNPGLVDPIEVITLSPRRVQFSFSAKIYKPTTDWLTQVMPRSTPYFPQIGDELIYFWKGHEMYVEGVTKHRVYRLANRDLKNLPWKLNQDLPTKLRARVHAIDFLRCLVSVELRILDWKSGAVTETQIIFEYRDIYGFDDFLVLRQRYERSIRRVWNTGDRFRTLWPQDKVWQLGTIQSKLDCDFLCYNVIFDNGYVKRMSPWDLEEIPSSFEVQIGQKGQDVPATNADLIQSGVYEARKMDWPPFGNQDEECKRIHTILNNVRDLPIYGSVETALAEMKLMHVNQVPYYVDFNTIRLRLANKFYRRVSSIIFDIKHITLNVENDKFYQKNSNIAKNARIIQQICREVILQSGETEVGSAYENCMKNLMTTTEDDDRSGSSSASSNAIESSSKTGKKRGADGGSLKAKAQARNVVPKKVSRVVRRRTDGEEELL